MPTATSNRALAALFDFFRTVPSAELAKAADDLRDDVDVTLRYNPDFQDQLAKPPAEHGTPVSMSGDGTATLLRLVSEATSKMSALASAYTEFGGKMDSRMSQVEKAVGLLLQEQVKARGGKLTKGPDWESREAAKQADKAAAEPDDDEIEKAVKAVQSGTATVPQAMLYLQHGATGDMKVNAPPDMTGAMQKGALSDEAFESTLNGLTIGQRAEALALRSRLAAVGTVPGLTIERCKAGISGDVLRRCFPHLAG